MADLTQWPILAAAVAVVLVLMGAMLKWSHAKAEQARKDMAAQTKAVKSLLDAARPPPMPAGNGRAPGDSGQWDVPAHVCSPDCRSEVLDAMKHLEDKFERLASKVGESVADIADTVQGHRVRLAVLETRAKIDRRAEDSARPSKG